MKCCKKCGETRFERFWPHRHTMCKPCLVVYNSKYVTKSPQLPKPKTYDDYLKEAGLLQYRDKYIKHFS